MRGEDGGTVTISNTLNIWFKVIISDNRDLRLESKTVSVRSDIKSFKVLSVEVLSEDLREDLGLDFVCVHGHVFNELELLSITVAWWRT